MIEDAASLGKAVAKETRTPHPFAPVAMVVVVQRSASLQGPAFEAARETARRVIDALAPDDLVAVVAFDSEALVVVRPQLATNRMRIAAELSRLTSGGGTSVLAGLAEAFAVLDGLKLDTRHVVLISAGVASSRGPSELVQRMIARNITISAIGLPGADRAALSTLGLNGKILMSDERGLSSAIDELRYPP